VLLLVGEGDLTVPPTQADSISARLPHARIQRLPRLGHLAHEERPGEIADTLQRWFSD
jgi:magnesium chelatase accessory protein